MDTDRTPQNMKPFDFERCSARIRTAQQMMNVAPTADLTAYWCRIWRARRRVYRIASKREIHLAPSGPTYCGLCGEWPARTTDRGPRCHMCETRELGERTSRAVPLFA